MIFGKIDATILSTVTALVHLANRKLGWNRHDLIAAILTVQFGLLVVSMIGMIGALAISPYAAAFVPHMAAAIASFMIFNAHGTWKREHALATSRSRSLDTYAGWQEDMRLTSIHTSIRERVGHMFLVGEAFLVAFLLAVFAIVMTGPSEVAFVNAIPLAMMTIRQALDTVARYVLSVPPAPPGSSRHRAIERSSFAPSAA